MQPENYGWRHKVIRAFGVLNIVFAAAGFYFIGRMTPSVVAQVHNFAEQSHVREAYYTMTLVDGSCLIALAVGGAYLWRLSRKGLLISNIVFVTELVWLCGTVALPLALMAFGEIWRPLAMGIAGAGGIGGMGVAPQILTGYPVIALVGLNLLRGSFSVRKPGTRKPD